MNKDALLFSLLIELSHESAKLAALVADDPKAGALRVRQSLDWLDDILAEIDDVSLTEATAAVDIDSSSSHSDDDSVEDAFLHHPLGNAEEWSCPF